MDRLDEKLNALVASARRESPPAFASVAGRVTRRLRAEAGRPSVPARRMAWRPPLSLLAGMGLAAAMVALASVWVVQTADSGWEDQVFAEPTAVEELAWIDAL